jgi:hypothetical protein
MLPDRDVLLELFDYDPLTGVLCWRHHFRNPSRNGQVAGGRSSHGYMKVQVEGRQVYVHRVIWKLVYGVEPPEIDHVNRDGTDNRLANLRAASRSENERNIPGRSSTGAKGVTWSRRAAKPYKVQVMLNYKGFHGGRFATLEEAAAAAETLRERLHGTFARHI